MTLLLTAITSAPACPFLPAHIRSLVGAEGEGINFVESTVFKMDLLSYPVDKGGVSGR